MKQFILLFVIVLAALLVVYQLSGSSSYFISIGIFIISSFLLYMNSNDRTMQKILLVIGAIVALHIAGQFDAIPIRIISTFVIIAVASYKYNAMLRSVFKKSSG